MHATNRRRKAKSVLGAIAIAVFSYPVTARAQNGAPGTDTVTAIADAFFAAVVSGRWSDASGMLDTASLSALRRLSADYVRHWRAARPLTLRQYMEMNPDVSRAVATYQVKQTNERTRELGKALRAYGVEDPDSLLSLPMARYAARWLEMHDERWLLRESARRCGRDTPADVPIAPYRIIATVPGDEVAYVLYDPGAARSPGANDQDPRPRVMVLRRRGSTWSIIPREDLIGWGEMINACG